MAGGFAGMMLHWVAEMSHQLGHANAARETGYPMTGVRFRLLIGISEYPGGEPDLPPDVHIRRALGGPTRSLRVTLLAGLLALLTRPLGAIPTWLGIFFFLDNLLVMTIGAFLPLGFTDGSTILHWRKVKRDA